MNRFISRALALPALLFAPHVLAPAQAQDTVMASTCEVITGVNEGACCAEENRHLVDRFLTEEGRRICDLSDDDRASFFSGPDVTGSLPVRPGIPGGPPVDQPPPGSQPPPGTEPPPGTQPPTNGGPGSPGGPPDDFTGNPGNEPGVNGPGREVGYAGEDPRSEGFHSGPSGEAFGRSGTPGSRGNDTASAHGSDGPGNSSNSGRGRSGQH